MHHEDVTFWYHFTARDAHEAAEKWQGQPFLQDTLSMAVPLKGIPWLRESKDNSTSHSLTLHDINAQPWMMF